MEGCLFAALLVAMTTRADAVGTGGRCSSNADCTSTNTNSYCLIAFTVASCGGTGYCVCNSGFMGNLCVPNKKKHGEICSVNTDCETDLTCDNNACVCATSTYTYRNSVMLCLTPSMKAHGEICISASECYNDGNPGMTCVNTCQCLSGYIEKDGLCNQPYYGQVCTAAVGCTIDGEVVVGSDSSRQTETCQSGVCKCPSTSDLTPYELGGTDAASLCLTKFSGFLIGDGQSCTVSNECGSKLCSTCLDGTTAKKCIRPISGSSRLQTSTNILGLLCLLVYFIL